jgi:hypothetical protein
MRTHCVSDRFIIISTNRLRWRTQLKQWKHSIIDNLLIFFAARRLRVNRRGGHSLLLARTSRHMAYIVLQSIEKFVCSSKILKEAGRARPPTVITNHSSRARSAHYRRRARP